MARVHLSFSYTFKHRPCEYFLICLMCRSCLVNFWISFRRNCSTCSCRFIMSVGEVNSRSAYVTILNWICLCLFLKVLYSFLYIQCFTLSRHSVYVCLTNKVPWWEQLIVCILISKRLFGKHLISLLLYVRFYSPTKCKACSIIMKSGCNCKTSSQDTALLFRNNRPKPQAMQLKHAQRRELWPPECPEPKSCPLTAPHQTHTWNQRMRT